MLEIRAETIIAAEPARVWEQLADHENMDKWTDLKRVVRIRPGTPEPDGVGAVRRLYATGFVMEERIIRFEPPRCLEYHVIQGAPGRTALGQMTLTPYPEGGTLVFWKVSMHPYLPGTSRLIKAFLQRSLEQGLDGLKRRLEPERLLAIEARSRLAPSAPAIKPRRAATRIQAQRETAQGA